MNIDSIAENFVKTLTLPDVSAKKITAMRTTVPVEQDNATGVNDSVTVRAKKQLNVAILQSAADVSLQAGNTPMALTLKSVIEGINAALQKSMGEHRIEKAYQSGLDVSPSATAGRIVNLSTAFLGAYQTQHPEMQDSTALTSFTAIISGGIDQGFSDAKAVLKGLNVLQGETAANIEQTYALVQDGLRAFVERSGLAAK